MKIKNVLKTVICYSALIVLVLSLFSGCSSDNQGKIAITGSTSVEPLAVKLKDVYTGNNPGLEIEIQGIGSSGGIKAANEGTVDIGNASRNLKPEEKEWGLTEYVIARDGIAVVVHPDNPVSDISKDKIAQIYKGEITNWKDVGGPDKKIYVISRESGSGTRGAFEELVGFEDELLDDAIIANGNGGVKADVSKKDDAIGYISLGYVDDTVKSLKIDGTEATVENIQKDEYPIARPFLMVTKGNESKETKAFLDFILSDDGQKIVAEEGYIPVN